MLKCEIERIAKEEGCTEVVCEVYNKSEHAMSFYEHRGYTTYGATETMKYKELKMRKIFEVAMKKILIIGEGFCRALLSRKPRAWVMRY